MRWRWGEKLSCREGRPDPAKLRQGKPLKKRFSACEIEVQFVRDGEKRSTTLAIDLLIPF